MFRKANAIAREFVGPVVISSCKTDGSCSAGIASYVVINSDGWIATAWHIIERLQWLIQDRDSYKALIEKRDELQADAALDPKAQQERIAALTLNSPQEGEATAECSAWCGINGTDITDVDGIPEIDLAVGRLQPFDAAWITRYPVFKDPARDFEPGVSLCKLGFPFHSITPIWHDDTKTFELPPGSVPLPFFPIEGILTRIVEVDIAGQKRPYPLLLVETSTPGLRGQSGGATFDTQGTVWAIQSKTASWPLGFEGLAKDQYLNVGLGVHTATLLALLDSRGITYEMSDY